MHTKYFYTDKIETIFLCTKVNRVGIDQMGIVSKPKKNLIKQMFTDRVRNDRVKYDWVRNDRVRNDRGLEMIVNHSL